MTYNSLDYDFLRLVEQRAIKPKPVIRNYHDWKIHKILSETKRVYICPARHNDKTYTQLEVYATLMAQNKDVKIIRAEDVKKAVDKFRSIPDFDLEFMLERRAKYEAYWNYLYERCKREDNK